MNKRNTQRILVLLCLAALALLLCACGKNKTTNNESAATATPSPTEAPADPTPTETPAEPTPTEGPSEKELWYNAMIEDSLLSDGNNARLLRVIEKARNGEDVYIATIGGSITEGAGAANYKDCYAASFATAFAEEFGKDGGVKQKWKKINRLKLKNHHKK